MCIRDSLYTFVPLYLCTFVPLYLCTFVPLYLCTFVPLYLYTFVPLYLCTPKTKTKFITTNHHHLKQTTSLFFFLFLSINALSAQFQLTGIVTDSLGDPLPFVNILINKSQKDGVSTDIDGKFIIDHQEEINQLTFSYLGYKNLRLTAPFKQDLKVVLTSTAYSFEAVTIVAGENPAHRIIRKVVANRNLNDPEKMDSYSLSLIHI